MPCDTRQGKKVGSSVTREVTRSKCNFIANPLPQGLEIMVELWSMAKKIESNPTTVDGT